jgi:broad specificity phosphatase PhoE
MELYLVRHGETEWSRARRHTGRSDPPLSPAGEAEARALGEHLRGLEVDRVLSSPLTRAVTTAKLAGFGDRVERWDALRILTTRFLGLPPDAARHLFLGTASLSVLGIEHEWPAILLWNEQEGSGAHTAETGTVGWRGIPA